MMDSSEAKGLLKALGADLCGVAGMERFAQAPAGYPPRDVCPYNPGRQHGPLCELLHREGPALLQSHKNDF